MFRVANGCVFDCELARMDAAVKSISRARGVEVWVNFEGNFMRVFSLKVSIL